MNVDGVSTAINEYTANVEGCRLLECSDCGICIAPVGHILQTGLSNRGPLGQLRVKVCWIPEDCSKNRKSCECMELYRRVCGVRRRLLIKVEVNYLMFHEDYEGFALGVQDGERSACKFLCICLTCENGKVQQGEFVVSVWNKDCEGFKLGFEDGEACIFLCLFYACENREVQQVGYVGASMQEAVLLYLKHAGVVKFLFFVFYRRHLWHVW
ncbi:hypothetical protein L7F22_035819 [Adiantum nelumboides]|nr:hypothetical protein [Adiantum nelumboides]